MGKTTLLEAVIRALVARGVRVAIAKDTHHTVELDQPGKDTWRVRQAGAGVVVLATDSQLALFERREQRPSLAEIATLIGRRADLLLAEGFRDEEREPAILVWRAALGAPPRVRGPLAAVVSDDPYPADLPRLGFGQVDELASLLLAAGTSAQSS